MILRVFIYSLLTCINLCSISATLNEELHLLGDTGRLKNAAELKKLLIEEGIIPDLIDEHEAPPHGVKVLYKNRWFSYGNKLLVFDIVEEPVTVNWPLVPKELYTLIMTGLDNPSREDPKDREYLHWLVTNIPTRNLRQGQHLPPYIGATRHYQTGIHRIVILVYKQSGFLELTGDHHQSDFRKVKRKNFSTRNFTKTYNLGAPVAINFAEVDDTCDIHMPPDLPESGEEEEEDEEI